MRSRREVRNDIRDDVHIPTATFKAIRKVHNSTVGHLGIKRTVERLKLAGYSVPYMTKWVSLFIRRCTYCQQLSEVKPVVVVSPFVDATLRPMQRINIDTIGPLPPTSQGYQHIMVSTDTFTRYVNMWPLISTAAEPAANALVDHMCRYGVPDEILSDQGPQFVNAIIAELCRMVGTEHLLTIAYSKEENGIVERANKEVMRHLRAIMLDSSWKADWNIYLPLVMRIINAKPSESTGCSPAQLVFGERIDLNNGFIYKLTNNDGTRSVPTWNEEMTRKQEELLALAEKHQVRQPLIFMETCAT